MAMNKQEKEDFENLKIWLALRYTGEIEGPDVQIPESDGKTIGYYITPSCKILKAMSTSYSHATTDISNEFPTNTTSQRGIPLYSSKVKALEDSRRMLEREYGKKLLEIDRMIIEEKKTGC